MKYNILLTCAGGPAAVGVIKSLKKSLYDTTIVAVDSDDTAVGLYLADKKYTVPFSYDPEYWNIILDIIKKENINLLIPTGDSDVYHFSQNKTTLEQLGVIVYMSDFETIKTCQDKYEFYQKCSSNFSLPDTSEFPTPKLLFAKPKRGSGSRGIKLYSSLQEAELLKFDSPQQYIFQEYLPGAEYTVDVLNDLNGKLISCIVRERIQVKAGISTKGKIIRDSQIENICISLCSYLNIKGPVCIQLKRDIDGFPKIIELNPRIGGGSYFCTLAGVNIPELMIESLENPINRVIEPKEITVVRYFEEIII